jgi:hypothetical protein
MGISQTTAAIMVFLTGLLPASCHKEKPEAKTASSAVVATNTAAAALPREFGEITLTNRSETCLQLADGKSCVLTPRMVDAKNVSITVAVESPNSRGDTTDFSVVQVTGRTGKPMEVTVGSLRFSFIPQVVDTAHR